MESFQLQSLDGINLDAALHKPTGQIRGSVIQAHGITADMNEGGMFRRLAEGLCSDGLQDLQFTFRGHGKSGGTQRGMTIAGEMLDLQASIEFAVRNLQTPRFIVAASFGAASTCLSLPFIEQSLSALVLWNPVLDLKGTFVDPSLPWGKENFGETGRRELQEKGYLLIDGEFEMGRVVYEECKTYRPHDYLMASTLPVLIVHGDKDTAVSYAVAAAAAKERSSCELFTVKGSDHGFDSRDREDQAIQATRNWLGKRLTSTASE